MTKRGLIAEALLAAFQEISTSNGYNVNLHENVKKRFIFPDEDPELPLVAFSAGPERITYQPGGFQDRYLGVSVRIYIESEDDPQTALEELIQDIEIVIEKYSTLQLSDGTSTRDIRVTFIDTDQGVLAPLGTGEIQLIVEY